MVVPIGKLVNKFSFPTHFSKSNMTSNFNNPLPSMSNKIDVGMDIQSGVSPSINSEEQGRNPLPTANSSRESSLVSSGHTTSYHERMDMNVAPEIEELNTESRELSYETEHERAIRVSTAANQQEPTRSLDGNNEAKSTHVQYEDDNINIQIPYDLNAPMEPEL